MPMTLRFELFPQDVGRAVDFYVAVLGFEVERDERADAEPYGAVGRDQVRIGFAGRTDVRDRGARRPPTGVELVLEVDDLDAERARVMAAGWPIDTDVQSRPWGLRDFRLTDPDGYYLRLTER